MSMYKTIFWSDEYADLSTDQSIQLTNGDALVFGESAFSTLDEAVAAAGSNAIVIKVASGKYDSFTVINEGVTMTDVNVVAVDFNGGEVMIGGEAVTVADSGIAAADQATILADLNDINAGNGKVFVAASEATADMPTIYVGMGEAGYVAGASATVITAQDTAGAAEILNTMYSTTVEAAATSGAVSISKDYTSADEGWGSTKFANWNSAYSNTTGSTTITVEANSGNAGYIGDSNNSNKVGRNVIVESGSSLYVQRRLLKIDKTLTFKAGASFVDNHVPSVPNPYTHIDGGKLYVGEANSTVRATMNFKDNSVATLWGAIFEANNADISLGDFASVGKTSFTDSDITVNGSLSFGAHQSQSSLNGNSTMTNSTMTVKGHDMRNDTTYFANDFNRIAALVMDKSTITINDGADGTAAATVQLGYKGSWVKKTLTLKNNSNIIVESGTAVTALWDVTLENSTIKAGALTIQDGSFKLTGTANMDLTSLTIADGKTLTIDSTSTLTLDSLAGDGKININLLDGFKLGDKVVDFTGNNATEDMLSKITFSGADGYEADIVDGDIVIGKASVKVDDGMLDLSQNDAFTKEGATLGTATDDLSITTGAKDSTDVTETAEIKSEVVGKDITLNNSKELAVTGSIKAEGTATISNSGTNIYDEEGKLVAEATFNGGYADGEEKAAKVEAEKIVMQNDGHANVDLDAKTIIIANNSVNTLIGNIGTADTESVEIATGTATADGVDVDDNGDIDGTVEDSVITATTISLDNQKVIDSELNGKVTVTGNSEFTDVTVTGSNLFVKDNFTARGEVNYKQVNFYGETVVEDGAVLTGSTTIVSTGSDFTLEDGAEINSRFFNVVGGNADIYGDINLEHSDPRQKLLQIHEDGVANIKEGAAITITRHNAIVNAGGTLNVDGGDLIITADTVNVAPERGGNIYNSGAVNVTAGLVDIKNLTNNADATVAISGGTVKISDTLTNNGTFTVSGESSLNIAELAGNTITALDGAKLSDTTIASTTSKELVVGEQDVASTVTFAGDNKISKISAGAGDSVIVEAGASLELTGNRSGIGSGATWSINGGIVDAKAVTDEEKADLTVAFNAVNGLSLSDYSGSTTTWNINNAYAKVGAANGVTSKNDNNAGGKFEINITNSIFESASKWAINTPKNDTITNQPAFELNVKDSVFTVGNYYTNNQKNSVANVDNSKFSATAFGNIGEFNVTNGAETTFGLANAVQDWASKGSLNAGKLYVNDASFTITNTSIEFYNVGDIVLEDGATVTFGKLVNAAANDVTLGAINTTFADQVGSITIDADAKFIAGTLTNNGTITITNEAAGWTGHNKVIDLSGTESLEGKINIENLAEGVRVIYGSDGDVTLTDADMSKFYVNTAYAGKAYGDKVGEKLYFGVNAFADYNTALNAASDGMEIDVIGSNPDTFYIGKSDSDTDVTVNFTGDVKALWKNMVRVDAGSTGNVINGSTLEYAGFGVRGTLNVGSEDGETGIATGKYFNIYGENGYPAAEVNVYSDSTLKVNDGSQNTSYVGHGSDANRKGVLNVLGGTVEAKYLKVNAGTGEINVENGTLTVGGALTNNGTVNVTGESTLQIKNAAGSGWINMDSVSLDADTNIQGGKIRFTNGTSNLDGATINGDAFQVGLGGYKLKDERVNNTEDVVVNVTNGSHVHADDVTYYGWVGSGYFDTDAEKAEAMTGATYTLNIDDSHANFGYLHVSHDGIMNVTGNGEIKTNYGVDYSFRAGTLLVNGEVTFADNNKAHVTYTNVSCDNGTDDPGKLVIKNGAVYSVNGDQVPSNSSLTISKNGIVEVDNATLDVKGATTITEKATLSVKDGIVKADGTITNSGKVVIDSSDVTGTINGTAGSELRFLGDNTIDADLTIDTIDRVYVGSLGTSDSDAVVGTMDKTNLTVTGTTVNAGSVWVGAQYADGITNNMTSTLNIGAGAIVNINDHSDTTGGNSSLAVRESGIVNITDGGKVNISGDLDTVIQGAVTVDGDGSEINFAPVGPTKIYKDNAILTIQNGAVANFGSYPTGNIMIGDSRGNKGQMVLDNGTANFERAFTVYANGILSLSNGSKLTAKGEKGHVNDAGPFDVVNYGTITVTDSTFTAYGIDNQGYFNLSVSSDLFNSLTGEFVLVEQTGDAGMDVTKLTVNVAGTNHEVGKSWEVGGIQYTLSTGTGNDVILSVKPQEFIVDASFNEETPGYGFNKFSSISEAVAKAKGTNANIIVNSDITEAISGNLSGNIISGKESGVTITNTNSGYLYVDKHYIGENVTLSVGSIFFNANEGVVDGTVIANGTYYHGYDSKTTINGNTVVNGNVMLRYNNDADAGIYVAGNAEAGKAVDAESQFDISGYIGHYSGTFSVKDAKVNTGYTLLTGATDSGYAAPVIELDNAYYHITGIAGGRSYGHLTMDDEAVVNVTNNSVLDITGLNNYGVLKMNGGTMNVIDSTLKLGRDGQGTNTVGGTLNLIDSTLDAVSLKNTGTFTVTGDSTVKLDKFTSTSGKAVTFGGAEDRSELTIGSASGNGVAINVDRLNIYKSDVTLSDNVTVGAPTGAGETYGLHKIQDSTIDLNGKTMTYKGFTVLDSYEGVSQLGSNQGVTIKNGEFNVTDSGHLCFQGYDHVIAENATVNFVGASGFSMVNVYGSLTVNGKLHATHDESTQHGYDNVGTTNGDPNSGFPKEKYPQSVLTVSGVNAEYIIENGHMFNVIHETDSAGAGTMNIVNGATFSFTGADGRSDVGLFFNSNIVNVDAQSSFTVGNYRGYDQSKTVKGSFNSANAGEMVVLGEVNVLYNLATADLILKAGAALSAGSITVDNLTLAIGSELTLGSGNSTIAADYITVTGKLVPENAEFTLVASGWTGALAGKQVWFDVNGDGMISAEETFTVKTDDGTLSGINFVSIGGNLYVKDFGAAITGIYIGELPANAQTGDKVTTADGATYTVGVDAFATAADAAATLNGNVGDVESITLGNGDHVDEVAAKFGHISEITIHEGITIVDEQAAAFSNDLVINNKGHLDAKITVAGDLTFTNTAKDTLVGSYTAENITGTNTGAMAGSYTATTDIIIDNNTGSIGGDNGEATFNASYVAITGGDASNVTVNAGNLDLSDTNTFGINADSGIFAGDKFGIGNIFLNGSANMSIDGDINDTNVNINSDLEDHTGTVTLDGAQTFSGNISANKIVVAGGNEVTFNLNTVDFKELNIAGSLNADFTQMYSFSDAGALTGAGTLNTTHTDAWIVNDSVTRDVSGFSGTVNMTNADASIVLGNGDFDPAAEAKDSYFSKDATVAVNGNQKVVLAGDGVNTATTYTGDGIINVGEYANDAFAEQAEDFSQTLSGDNTGFTGTINVSEGAVLKLESKTGATKIYLDYETTQSAVDTADELFDTQLILNAADVITEAEIHGDADDIIDVNANQTLNGAGALDAFSGKVELEGNDLTLNAKNTTSAEFIGNADAALNVNADQFLNADNTNFDGKLNINSKAEVQFNGDFGTVNGNSTINFNANDSSIYVAPGYAVDINSKLVSNTVSGEIFYIGGEATLTADGALDNFDGTLRLSDEDANTKLILEGNNTTNATLYSVNSNILHSVELNGGDLTLTNNDALKDYYGAIKVNNNKITLDVETGSFSATSATFYGNSNAVMNVNDSITMFGNPNNSYNKTGKDAISGFAGTINVADNATLTIDSTNTTAAKFVSENGTLVFAANNMSAANTLTSDGALDNVKGNIDLSSGVGVNSGASLVLNGINTTEADVSGDLKSVITANANQYFTGDVSGFKGLYDIADGANVTLSGTIADVINAQGDTLTLSNTTEKEITVNAGKDSDLDNLNFGKNDVILGTGDGDDFTNVIGNGDITDFGKDQDFGTVEAGVINVTGSEDALTIGTLTADINITVDDAQTDDKSDVSVSGNFTGSINVTVDDGNDLAGGYKLVTNSAFTSNSTIDLTVGGTFTDNFKVDELVVIDGKAYLLQLKDNTLILTQMAGFSNFVVVDGDWSDKVPYQSVMDGNSERIIGYDAAANLDKAVEWIRGYDKGVNANAGTNPGDATIELTEGKYTLAAGTLMTDANGVTQLILKSRDGQTATITGVIAGSDGSDETTLTLENVRIQGDIYGGRNLVIDNANDLRSSGNVLAGGVLNRDMANDSSLTINGGYFGHRIMVGGSVNDTSAGNTITVGGNTLVVIDNQNDDKMVISSNIYGGSWAATGNVVQTGNAEIRINVENATQIRGNIFVSGGASSGNTYTMNGDSTITFSGNASLLTFTGSVIGNLNDPNNATKENLVFSNFNGKFNGSISGFDTITISGDTSLELGRRQGKTSDTGLVFNVNSDTDTSDGAMYIVRDANYWEFANTITINTEAFTTSGSYVIVDNYAAGFDGFTFTINGTSYTDLANTGLVYENNQLVYNFVSDAQIITGTNGDVAGDTVKIASGASVVNVTGNGEHDINIVIEDGAKVSNVIGCSSDTTNGGTKEAVNVNISLGEQVTNIYGANNGAIVNNVKVSLTEDYNGTANFVVAGHTNATIKDDSSVVVADGVTYSTGNPELLVGGIYNASTNALIEGDASVVIGAATLSNGNIVAGGGQINGNTSIDIDGAVLNVNSIIGGTSWNGNVEGDSSVSITGSEVTVKDVDKPEKRAIYGGSYSERVTKGNTSVIVTDSTVYGNIVGGNQKHESLSTKVEITDSNIKNLDGITNSISAVGVYDGAATGVAEVVINNSIVETDIKGQSEWSTQSTLDINGGAITGDVSGFNSVELDVDAVLSGSFTASAEGTSLNITGISGLTTDTYGVKAIAGNVDSILAGATIENQTANTNGIFQLAGADNTIGTTDDIWAGLGTDANDDTIVAWGREESFVSETLAEFETKDLAIGDTFTSSVADSSTIGDDTNKKNNTHGTLA